MELVSDLFLKRQNKKARNRIPGFFIRNREIKQRHVPIDMP
jgi:ribosomal protein S17E